MPRSYPPLVLLPTAPWSTGSPRPRAEVILPRLNAQRFAEETGRAAPLDGGSAPVTVALTACVTVSWDPSWSCGVTGLGGWLFVGPHSLADRWHSCARLLCRDGGTLCAVTLYVVTLCVVTLWGSPCERSPCAWSPCTSVHAQWPQPVSDISRGIRCPRVTVPEEDTVGPGWLTLMSGRPPHARSQVEPWTPCPDPHREAWVPRGPRLETAAVVPVTEGVAEGTPLGAGTHVQAESSCGASLHPEAWV